MALLEYNMTAVGLSAIERAFRTIEGYATQHNQKMQRMYGAGTAGTIAPQHRLVNATREAEQQYAPGRREHQKAVDYRIRQELKAEREIQRSHERVERAKTRETERESRKRERIIEQEARAEARAAARHRVDVARTLRGSLGNAAGALTTVGAAGLGLTGLAGGAIAANAIHNRMKLEAAATGLANQMVGDGASPAEIQRKKQSVLSRVIGIRGVSAEAAVESARAFGGISGNYDLGVGMVHDLGKLSLATGVNLADLSTLAGNAYMKIKTPGMNQDEARKQTLEAVRTFAGQGNIGAVEIKDLAQYGGRLTAAAAQFKGTRVENMAKMGTLAQVAIGSGSATDAAEATMAAARFASDLTEHAKDVQALTIKGKSLSPFTDKTHTQFRSIDTLVADIMQATGGNMSKMKDIFGERSMKMAGGFQQIYLDAERTKKGSGREAVMAKFSEFQRATVSEHDVETRAAARLADTDLKLEESLKELNNAVAKELMPSFVGLVDAGKSVVPLLGAVASGLGGLGEAIGSSVKWVDDKLGIRRNLTTDESHQHQIESALAVANEGTMSPYGRLHSAEERLQTAKEQLGGITFSEQLGATLIGEETPTLKRYRQAEKDVRQAEQELKEYEKNSAELKANTDAMKALGDLMKKSTNAGGGGGGGGNVPPRGADGTPLGPTEFWNY